MQNLNSKTSQNFSCRRLLRSHGFCPWFAVATSVGIAAVAHNAFCADTTDPLLDLMLKKGMITEQEAEAVKTEAAALSTNTVSAPPNESKWLVGKGIKSIELFGDVRTRFEARTTEDPQGNDIDLQRLRYTMRVGLRGEVFDDFYFGFRIDPSANARSPWVTLGSSSTTSPTYQGPFGKSSAGLYLGQAYIGWRGLDWFNITLGKMANPLFTTPMVWDTDINPEGAAEKFKYTVGDADFFATFGQFLYQDTNPVGSPSGYYNLSYHSSNLPFLLAWQAGVDYHFTKKVSLKTAPILYNYTGTGANVTSGSTYTPDFSGTFVGQGSTNGIVGGSASWSGYPGGSYDGFAANQTGINDLLILEIPWELNYKMENIDARLFGDFAQNLHGSDRAQAAFNAQSSQLLNTAGLSLIPSAQTHDTTAYQIGVAVGNKGSLGLVTGSTSRKHAWEFRTYWQHIEQYALDPNLVDSDFFEGRLNMEGVYTALAYGFNENIIATARYGYARRINGKLGTGGSNQDIPQMNPIEYYNLLQLDVTCKF